MHLNDLRNLRNVHSRFVDWVIPHPLRLILLAMGYLVVTAVFAVACGELGKAAATLVLRLSLISPPRHPYLAYQLAKVFFFTFGSLIWTQYLMVTFQCFLGVINEKTTTVLRVAQLVAVTVLIFAAAHYYVALFSNCSRLPS